MGIIVRCILRELGATFLFGFVALTCLLLIVGLVREAIDKHMPLIYVWQLIPYVFAEMSSISLPVTLLLAVTVFFARMSGNNEIIALKALGVPPRAFLLPVFAIAFVVSLIGVGINELSVTWGRQGFNAVIYRAAEDIMIGQLRRNHRFETDGQQITIVVQGVDEQRRLIEPTIILKRESATIEARRAQITIDFDTKFLTIALEDFQVVSGSIQFVGGDRTLSFSLSEIIPDGRSDRPSNMGLHQTHEEQRRAVEQIEQQRRIIAAHRTFRTAMGSVDDWTIPQIQNVQANIRVLQSHIDRLSIEPPRRWATGFCCFFFVLLGAPLAIWMRKSDFFSSFFACFLPILILYYPLFAFGLDQAKKGALPPMCVWLANVGIGLIGLWFLRQIHRY
jgi:lipopolysaccharide export system permease protein